MKETGQTIIKMIESLPFNIQERGLRDVQAIVADAFDESRPLLLLHLCGLASGC